jgi:hypothetical protein
LLPGQCAEAPCKTQQTSVICEGGTLESEFQ